MLSYEILKLLLEKPSMTFQEIMIKMRCGRTACNKTLDELKEEGLIDAKPENWRLGQKRFFSLTEKGITYYGDKTVTDLNASYAFFHKILEIRQLRNRAAFHLNEKEHQDNRIEAERIKEMSEHKEKVLAPLTNLFLEVAKDLAEAQGFIGVREDVKNVECHLKEGKIRWTIHSDQKLQSQCTGLSYRKWNCRRCGNTAFLVLGTNGLCPACCAPPKESPEPNNHL
jgi:predicted transcriptional regulator